jgi:hypothetical protein
MHLGLSSARACVAIDVFVRESEDAMEEKLGAATCFGVESEWIGGKVVGQRHDAELLVI